MSNKKKPPFDANSDASSPAHGADRKASGKLTPPSDDFDPTIPEDGVVVPSDDGSGGFFGTHLPSHNDIAHAARESFGGTFPEERLQELMQSCTEINESVRRIMHEHMTLGFRFGEVIRIVHAAYIAKFGDDARTHQRAQTDAYLYLEKLHQFSRTKIKSHLRAYAKFHANTEAVEFLRQTDMQLLLPKDLGDEIVNAVIEQRKANPDLSTRAVRDLIAAYREKVDELTATREQVETNNEEVARLTALYDISRAEEQRVQREMEQMRLAQTANQEETDRLRNDLALSGNSRNALHQQLSEVEKELAVARREVAEANARPPVKDDAAREDLNRLNDQFQKLLKESTELQARIEAQKAQETEIAAKVAEAETALEANKRVEEEMNALVIEFGQVAQRYTSVQLLCTAEGKLQRYAPMFNALADVVGKFHTEIVAAAKAA
ncbi:hypothetical protein FHX57_006432 [Paraburkholderia tropica]|uniref:hypothetical protein n=1 Tax=Paraburkholderia tropica TaxID=92647 RepID=UPI001621D19F|nr:hypothetical protein [Paraburkholderia tropica]MBB2984296.1 hypothetical protein [Paraburkholderia tropica]MBB3004053.1 hypothetical protein [Paraburkholderia tropica]MBB6323210.1 hypothetical protein [Paraburkholderia tropica]